MTKKEIIRIIKRLEREYRANMKKAKDDPYFVSLFASDLISDFRKEFEQTPRPGDAREEKN
jgi:hypothetical protein